ncbi:MAG: hypothetical protein ABWZ30_05565 [Jiangellaceae bacterium]
MMLRIHDAEFWRMCTLVVGAFLAVALLGLISLALVFANQDNYGDGWTPGPLVATFYDGDPPGTLTPSSPADPPDLADQVAVAWGVATGWPNSEKWGHIMGYTSVGDDLLVHTNLTDPVDQSELCQLLFEMNNDDVIALDPQIDQILITGTDGQVIWSCVTTAEVQ